jgi:hypothetical protein
MKYTIEDTFDVSAQRYWEVFFSEPYNAALWPVLNVEHELLELDRKGEGADLVIRRRSRLTPKREVPGFLQKLIKGAISYVEENKFVARDNKMDTSTTPSFMADKIDNHGLYRLEELGPNKVKRVWEGVCACRVPLVGGRVEKYLVDEIRESYRKATEFTRKWHAEHPAG